MTTGMMTSYRSGVRATDDGFARLLRAEWTKFRTVRGWVIGMIVAALLPVLLALGGGSGSCNVSACNVPVGPGGEEVTDQFYFVHQPLAGNGSITVRVTSLTGLIPDFSGQDPRKSQGPRMSSGLMSWAKAGIIIKENTSQGSAYAAMMVTGSHGVRMQYDYTQDTAGLAGAVSAASPRWLRLTRVGDTLTGYDSADSTHWTQVGTAHLAGLSTTVQAGIFATSPQYTQAASMAFFLRGIGTGPSEATAAFDHVSRQGTWPSGAWSGANVGGSTGGPAPGPAVGFQQAGGGFTVTGSGDIAPNVPPAGIGVTIAQVLVGTFAGLIAVIVVGAMFMTAEYRRGLIRVTLTASPRRGQVLAAKAIVIGAVTFVAGLASTAVAVLLGVRMMRANGQYVIPVTTFTELRVMIGTAAVLAVAAVFALAVGAMLRRSAATVTAVIVVIVLPYFVAVVDPVLPAGATEWLARVTPAAAFAVQQTIPQYSQISNLYTPANGYFPLPPWAGFAVLCAYAALALGLAVILLNRRDA
jgi:ABC-type transport system involved in multi-copper enzyme maturation permease subunit